MKYEWNVSILFLSVEKISHRSRFVYKDVAELMKGFSVKYNLLGKFKIFKVMWIMAKSCSAIVSCSYLIAPKGN